ncbi:MAG: DUF1622 domain-containing protein [Thermoleophilia bacterium]|nr:DUF1622 domain-containing protein [Thermoleophilia bacterium]
MEFSETVELVGKSLDILGVAVIVLGTAAGLITFSARFFNREQRPVAFQRGRQSMARAILLGLEVLIAADIIRTVAISPTFQNVGVLAAIVLVRTFLSFTLEVEVDGRWPWRRQP